MVDGINNIGSGLRALAGSYSANANGASATIISSPPGISAARLNWMPVAVSKITENNLLSLRTPMGEMSIRANGLQAAEGDRLQIKINNNGTLAIRANFVPDEIGKTNMAGAPAGGASRVLPSQPLYSPAVALSVAAVEPVKALVIGANNPVHANKVVSSIFPHLSSGAFSFAAALFPHNVRGGMLADAVRDQEGTKHLHGRTHELAEKVLLSPAPKIEGSFGWLGWNLPFYNQSKIMESKWFSRDEEDEKEQDDRKHTLVEIHLEFAGRVQISCLSNGENAHIQIVTEHPVQDELVNELLSTSVLISKVLGINATAEVDTGLDKMLQITQDEL